MAHYNQQSGYMGQDEPAWDKVGVGHGYGDQDHGNETTGYDGTDNGAGRSKQTQFGLQGKTSRYAHERAHPQATTDPISYGAVDPFKSDFDKAPHGIDTVPAGDGWGPEDTSRTHGARKDGLVNKIKKKLPGHHTTADGSVTHSDQKGVMEKIKDKLPGHHGSSDAGM